MPDRASNWAELLTPQLTEAFYQGHSNDGRRASMIPTIFNTRTSQRAFEEHFGVGVVSSKGWRFEGRVNYDDRAKGFAKRYTHVEFAKGLIIERRLVDDNLTDIKFDEAHGLGDSAFRLREKGAASLFNGAFTDSGFNDDGMPYAGGDGVGLCSTVHPLSAEDTATQSNEGTLALTADNLGATRLLHGKITDDTGDLMDVMSDTVLIPFELEDAAIRAGLSPLEPDTANNAVNPQEGRFRYVVWHYLQNPRAWFSIDSARRARSLLWYDRIPLEFAPESDFDTLQSRWRAYMRYSYGSRDWAWIYGQNPS